ncbi:N-acetylglucosaminyl-phosphatidylinositol de-N-acetylase, a glycan bosynthesis protein [Leptodontidium sp. 2 PMI_412]|nr:N-acetylglucosaminyl-phosphatidylinositol de-N-acetylase, a glycan bosynthesis protein [Leptodontidium sp. 2 PMI_412]
MKSGQMRPEIGGLAWVNWKSILPYPPPRKIRRLLLRLILVIAITPFVLQILLAYVVGSDFRLLPAELQQAKNLLIVTAHPDDECLFFAPSILGVLDRNPDTVGGLLVMSTGNNEGIGDTRKAELQGSCAALGVEETRCVALDWPEIQDNPRAWWDESLIESIVKEYVQKWHVDVIITFDEGGVSGHVNHRAVSAAIRNYASTDAHAPATYMLSTTMLIRKYTFLLDLPLTSGPFSWRILQALFSQGRAGDPGSHDGDGGVLVANTWGRYLASRQAFAKHASQYSWDRNLYMILSRYVWFNNLRRVRKQTT